MKRRIDSVRAAYNLATEIGVDRNGRERYYLETAIYLDLGRPLIQTFLLGLENRRGRKGCTVRGHRLIRIFDIVP